MQKGWPIWNWKQFTARVFSRTGGTGDISVLCLYDTLTGKSEEIARFSQLVEAPQFTPDGSALYFNSRGLIWRYNLADGTARRIDTGLCGNCNNDHVLSPDGKRLAVSCGDSVSFFPDLCPPGGRGRAPAG